MKSKQELDKEKVSTHERHFAKGADAKVYEGLFNGCKVAVKKISTQYEPQYSAAQYTTEKTALADLSSHAKENNVVGFIGYYQDDENYNLVMEYVDGIPFESYLSKNQLDWTIKYEIIEGVAKGLQYIHESGYIHRDIKCDNIMISKENFEPKIIDFGYAIKNDLQTHKVQGALVTMAPEACAASLEVPQLQKLVYTEKCDIFSFGVVIHEIAAQEPYGTTIKKSLSSRHQDRYAEAVCEGKREPIPETWPSELKDVISEAWDHNPTNRPTAKVIKEKIHGLRCTFFAPPPVASTKSDEPLVTRSPIENS